MVGRTAADRGQLRQVGRGLVTTLGSAPQAGGTAWGTADCAKATRRRLDDYAGAWGNVGRPHPRRAEPVGPATAERSPPRWCGGIPGGRHGLGTADCAAGATSTAARRLRGGLETASAPAPIVRSRWDPRPRRNPPRFGGGVRRRRDGALSPDRRRGLRGLTRGRGVRRSDKADPEARRVGEGHRRRPGR